MDFENFTPFPGESWPSFDHKGFIYQTTLIRVRYKFEPQKDGTAKLTLHPEQEELFEEDVYWQESENSSLRYATDYITYKPQTDIIINANTFSPSKQAQPSWQASIRIMQNGQCLLENSAMIYGKRQWYKKQLWGWILDDIESITQLPLTYEHAYGGTYYQEQMINDNNDDEEPKVLMFEPANPVGTGIIHKDQSSPTFAPQIMSIEDKLDIGDHYKSLAVIGFAAIDSHWKGRMEYAGTYDDHWITHHYPMPPEDFDPKYHQQSNPNMRLSTPLKFNNTFMLENMLPQHPKCEFSLPLCALFRFYPELNDRKMMNIDTVLIDIASEEASDWSVFVSYRLYEPHPLVAQSVQVIFEKGGVI